MITFNLANDRGAVILDEDDSDLADRSWWIANGYARGFGAQRLALHRIVITRMIGREPRRGEEVDHINHNKLDNRRSNLRLVNTSQNQLNQRGPQVDNTSGHLGVLASGRPRKPWKAQLGWQGKTYNLGHYATKEEAATAYQSAKAKAMRGEFRK